MPEYVGGIAYTVTFDTQQLINGQRQIQKSLDQTGQQLDASGKKVDGLSQSYAGLAPRLTAVAAAIGSLASALFLISQSDAFTKLNAQLKLATSNTDDFYRARASVLSISQESQSDLSAIGSLYARISNATKDMGASQRTVGEIVRVVALSMKVSGASAEESASAMLQLSQSFASGVFRGEEFNAVAEAAPRLLKALADGMKVPTGQLRQMAAEGKLTSDVLARALPQSLKQLEEEAKSVQTIGGAFQQLRNEVMLFVGGQMEASGAAKLTASAIAGLADGVKTLGTNFDSFITAAQYGAVAFASVMTGRFTTSVVAATAAIIANAQATAAAAAAETVRARAAAVAATEVANKAAMERRNAVVSADAAAAAVVAARSEVAVATAAALAQENLAKATQVASTALAESTRAELAALETSQASIAASIEQKVAEIELMKAYQARGIAMTQIGVATAELSALTQQQTVLVARQAQAVETLALIEAGTARVASASLTAAKLAETDATVTLAAAENTLAVARVREAEAAVAATAATGALTLAQRAQAAASATATLAARAAGSVMAALGGPIGVAILAIGALALAWSNTKTAAEEAADISEKAARRIAAAQGGQVSAPMRELMNVRDEAEANLIKLDAQIKRAEEAGKRVVGGRGNAPTSAKVDVSGLYSQREALRGALQDSEKAIEDFKKKQVGDLFPEADNLKKPPPTAQQQGKTAEAQAYYQALVAGNQIALDKIDAEEKKALADNAKHMAEDSANAGIYAAAKVEIVKKYARERADYEEKVNEEVADLNIALTTDEAVKIGAIETEAVRRAEVKRKAGVITYADAERQKTLAHFNAWQARLELDERNAKASADIMIASTDDQETKIRLIMEEALRAADADRARDKTNEQEYQAARVKAWRDADDAIRALKGQRDSTVLTTLQIRADTTGGAPDQENLIRAQAQQQVDAAEQARQSDLENEQIYADQKVAILARMNMQLMDLQASSAVAQYAMAQSAAGQMLDVLKRAGKDRTAIGKAVFLAERALAVATIIVNTEVGAAKAIGIAGPFGIPLAALIRATGYGSAALVAGMALSDAFSGGRQYGGAVDAGSLYRVNETGRPEMFTASNGNQFMLGTKSGQVTPADQVAGGAPWKVIINNAPPGYTPGYDPAERAMIIDMAAARGAAKAKSEIASEFASNTGSVYNALKGSTNVRGGQL